jgi:hypothetical protein
MPIVASVCTAGLLVAVLVELAGNRSLAVSIAVSCVITTLIMPWYIASETAKRNAPKSGHMIAYRIDRTGIETLAGFAANTLTWPEITKTKQHADQVALYYGRRSVQSIPTGTLTAEQHAHLQHLLKTRETNLARPYSQRA